MPTEAASTSKAAKRVPVLVVTGPIGAGKTTVVSEVGEILKQRDIPHATCDFDALTQLWPSLADDRFNVQLGVRNLRCFWENAASAGARRLVLGMTVETETERRAVAAAIPAAHPVFVRLTAPREELERRILARELGSAADWHVRRSRELVSIMDANPFEAAVIHTNGRSIGDIARNVLEAAGWNLVDLKKDQT